MGRPLVVGNWKMNGSRDSAALLASSVRQQWQSCGVEVSVCPPYVHLFAVESALGGSDISWGAQDVAEWREGAYTGEVSAQMLADAGCRFAIVGHSERRQLLGESDEVVAAKFEAARGAGLVPILCVGETLEERDAGITLSVVERQVQAVLSRVGAAGLDGAVVAYEPVWAIGTGRSATPAQAQEVHAHLRKLLVAASPALAGVSLLYGGSVKAANAAELFVQPDIDGALVGGASLQAEEFLAICRAAACRV